ncbi:MAG: T9SS type A sorting domain-containing protein, partial [Flammeovirgaceae bacterium]|nr:T9SS type A sorting domain-containing protein [Flammeovirgaceae bacterium]MDW8287733.1 T9SS type A sorting domain-containing protein [Flammeovirgaceae bacterium]
KQVDTDGKFEYTKVIAVNFTQEDAGSAQVLVYPNPLQKQERLTLEIKGFAPESEVSIQLVDMTGRVMYVATSKTTKSGMLNEELRMPTEIASGVYNLIIRDAEKSYTKRIVVR